MQNQIMTEQEILSFQGHEFTLVLHDGDTMPAYIKKIDLEKNLMSCWSFSFTTDKGHKFEPLNKEEETEGACCLVKARSLNQIIDFIAEIKTTGRITDTEDTLTSFTGCPF